MSNENKLPDDMISLMVDYEKMHRMIEDLDRAMNPRVAFKNDMEAMRKEAEETSRALLASIRLRLVTLPGMKYRGLGQ